MNLTEVLLQEGKVIHREEVFTADTIEAGGVSCPITKKTPVSITITNMGKKVLRLQGSTYFEAVLPCARCLTEVVTPFHISFDFETDMKLSDEARKEALDESDFLHGYNLDVDKLVYGETLLVWPARVLCRDDCKGLCSRCGQNLNLKTCDCDRTDLDPRMAKIRDIFRDYKEV